MSAKPVTHKDTARWTLHMYLKHTEEQIPDLQTLIASSEADLAHLKVRLAEHEAARAEVEQALSDLEAKA